MSTKGTTREFDLADILSITDGRLVSHQVPPIGGVYQILYPTIVSLA